MLVDFQINGISGIGHIVLLPGALPVHQLAHLCGRLRQHVVDFLLRRPAVPAGFVQHIALFGVQLLFVNRLLQAINALILTVRHQFHVAHPGADPVRRVALNDLFPQAEGADLPQARIVCGKCIQNPVIVLAHSAQAQLAFFALVVQQVHLEGLFVGPTGGISSNAASHPADLNRILTAWVKHRHGSSVLAFVHKGIHSLPVHRFVQPPHHHRQARGHQLPFVQQLALCIYHHIAEGVPLFQCFLLVGYLCVLDKVQAAVGCGKPALPVLGLSVLGQIGHAGGFIAGQLLPQKVQRQPLSAFLRPQFLALRRRHHPCAKEGSLLIARNHGQAHQQNRRHR